MHWLLHPGCMAPSRAGLAARAEVLANCLVCFLFCFEVHDVTMAKAEPLHSVIVFISLGKLIIFSKK